MKPRTILIIATLSTLIFTGCQNNDLSAQNQSLRQQITKLEQENADLKQQNETLSQNTTTTNPSIDTATIYTLEELTGIVDEFIVQVGSATPDVNNSGNLDQFFTLKRKGDQIEHALENHEDYLEEQYRTTKITRDEFRKLDRKIEELDDLLDSAQDRLEIAFGIDD